MINETVWIAAPVGQVWRHLSEPVRMSIWMPGIRTMRSRDGLELRAGSCVVFAAGATERLADVVEFEPERVITLSASDGAFTLTYRYCLAEAGGGSDVSLDARCDVRGFMIILAPLLRARIRKADRWQLAYLKGVVEKDRDARR